MTSITMRIAEGVCPVWLEELRRDIEHPFRMIAARAENPVSGQSNQNGLDTVHFHEMVETDNTAPHISFEIVFEGQRMRERLNAAGLQRLQRICEALLKKSPSMRGQRETVSVEVCCH